MITYNHEPYIKKAICSVLSQICSCSFELVIGEDCSTDGTKNVCEIYSQQNPQVELLVTTENLGIVNNFIRTLKKCRGKYIAICEGDDFWTDPYKLQKQVDFLEANSDYGLIYSDIQMSDENGVTINSTPFYESMKTRYSEGEVFWELLSGNFINSLTVCLRKEYIDGYIAQHPYEWFMYDYRLWLHVAQRTKIKFMNEKTACYRIHSQGISQSNGFFHKRSPLSQLSALNDYFQAKSFLQLTSINKYLLSKILWSIIRERKFSYKEKSLVWKLLFKNKAKALRSLIT
jgi:glycosyltransferase involved in cell wall biosynthesis